MKNQALKIGIIGAGNMGAQLGKLWSKAGYEVKFSSRNPQKLNHLLYGLKNATVGDVEETIDFADVVVLAVNYATIDAVIAKLAGKEKVIIDLTNPIVWTPERKLQRANLRGLSGGEELQRRLPEATVIKAFSSHYAASLEEGHRDYPIAVFYTTDNDEGIAFADIIIKDAGFAPLHYGTLNHSLDIELYGKYSNKIMSLEEAQAEIIPAAFEV
ncbi:MAG: NAD(P)-binding domain-containing protein [Bacteroidota bacterium]